MKRKGSWRLERVLEIWIASCLCIITRKNEEKTLKISGNNPAIHPLIRQYVKCSMFMVIEYYTAKEEMMP